ncbi:MAG: hypothetical protein IJA13_02045 [Clostridia bacterium]|nr:hypothetical protein [Clostridia bacterium]
MFKFIKRADAIDMVGDGATFKNVSISVKTEDGNEYILPITEFSETEIYGVVSQAEARVKICEENGVVTLLAEGGLIRDRSKGQFYDNANNNLNAKAAFSLTFSEIENLKSYTASNLVTFWTSFIRLKHCRETLFAATKSTFILFITGGKKASESIFGIINNSLCIGQNLLNIFPTQT